MRLCRCVFDFFVMDPRAYSRPGRARFSNDDYGGVPGAPGARGGGELGTEYVTQNKGDNQVVNDKLVFEGSLAGTFHRTRCQDACEDATVARFGCPGLTDVPVGELGFGE